MTTMNQGQLGAVLRPDLDALGLDAAMTPLASRRRGQPASAPAPTIRNATFNDLVRIDEIDRGAFPDMPYGYRMLRQQFDVHGICWIVAVVDDEICGYVMLAITVDRDAWLMSMAVSPNSQGKRYGEHLLRKVLQNCRKAQANALYLTVDPANERAVRLYNGANFERIDHEANYLGHGEPRDKYEYKFNIEYERPPGVGKMPPCRPGRHTDNSVPMPRCRRIELSDLGAISAIEQKTFGDQSYPYFVLRQLCDVLRASWLVVELDGSVVGYALVALIPEHRAWLLSFAVAEEYRGKGYGRLLLERQLELCRELPVESVHITVRPTNKHARRLYKHLGFTRAGYEKTYFGPGEPRFVLQYKLDR